MADCADYVVTIFFIYLLTEFIQSYDTMKCATPIPVYEIGNISTILFLLILNLTNDIQNHLFNLIKAFLFILLIPFYFIWTILGTVWIIQNMVKGNKCLNTTQIVFMFIGQFIIYFVYFILIGLTILFLKKFYNNSKIQEDGKKKLLMFYENEERAKNLEIDLFLNKYTILEESSILNKEREIILKCCTVDKSKLNDDDNCVICLDRLKNKTECVKIGCSHLFHSECIFDWYKVKPKCPMCKTYFREFLMKKYQESILEKYENIQNLDKV